VKLFFDEDAGTAIPEALRRIGIPDIAYVAPTQTIVKGTPDEIWLPWVGRTGHLVFSCNIGILLADAQRSLLIEHNVGAVFLSTGQEYTRDVLKLILNQWEWLEEVDAYWPRPFAFLFTITGRKTCVDLDDPAPFLRRRVR
jgi:hypothetical protein